MNVRRVIVALISTFYSASFANAVNIATVPIGNPGNAGDTEVMVCCGSSIGTSGYGSVGYSLRMGKTEVTNAQYVEFLNGVDPTGANTLTLYNSGMSSDAQGGIDFNNLAANGSKYQIKLNFDNKPVVFVSWYDTVRFANWLHNGQGAGDTENGAYTLLGGTPTPSNGLTVARNAGAKWWLPSEDEWYKAAYHKNDGVTGNYWNYPTSTSAVPYSDQPPGDDAPTKSNTVNFYKNDAMTNGYDDGLAVTGSPVIVNSQTYLTDVGAYTLSRSPYGTFDQGGNVWEFNESGSGSNRGVRGGSYGDFQESPSASLRNGVILLLNEGRNVGFRVATSVPEPSSLLLGAMAGMGLLWRRRRLRRDLLCDPPHAPLTSSSSRSWR